MIRSSTPVAERLRKLLHAGALLYVDHAPLRRGKDRLMTLVDRFVGHALYEVDGMKLFLSPHRLLDRYVIRQGSYAPELVRFIREAMSGGGGFIDVGANVGYLSLIAARAGGSQSRVYAFEPSAREYLVLLQHLALNGTMNIVPFPFGIGPTDEASMLWVAGLENPGMNSRFRQASTVGQFEINLAPVDSLLSTSAIRDVRCVKIDVEGDECSVLAGFERVMPLLTQAAFVVEVSPQLLARAGHSADEVYGFFDRHGFRCCRAARPELFQWDELFVAASAPDPAAIWF